MYEVGHPPAHQLGRKGLNYPASELKEPLPSITPSSTGQSLLQPLSSSASQQSSPNGSRASAWAQHFYANSAPSSPTEFQQPLLRQYPPVPLFSSSSNKTSQQSQNTAARAPMGSWDVIEPKPDRDMEWQNYQPDDGNISSRVSKSYTYISPSTDRHLLHPVFRATTFTPSGGRLEETQKHSASSSNKHNMAEPRMSDALAFQHNMLQQQRIQVQQTQRQADNHRQNAASTNSTWSPAASDPLYCPHEGCYSEFAGPYRHSNLGRHTRLEHGLGQDSAEQVENYSCYVPGCGKQYRRQDALLKHQRTRHPELRIPPPVPQPNSQKNGIQTKEEQPGDFAAHRTINNLFKNKIVHADIRVHGIDDDYEPTKTKQKVEVFKNPVQSKTPIEGKTSAKNGTGKGVSSTFLSKVEKDRKPIPMFKSFSHPTSVHTLSMSCRLVSYTISEDCTKSSTRHRFRALKGGNGRAP
jgi:hypothetical protein